MGELVLTRLTEKDCYQDIMEFGRAAARVTVLQRPPEHEGSPEPVAVERGAGVEEPVLGGEGGEVNTVQADLENNHTDHSSVIKMNFVLSQWASFLQQLAQCTRLI